jgi:hypothetical protein
MLWLSLGVITFVIIVCTVDIASIYSSSPPRSIRGIWNIIWGWLIITFFACVINASSATVWKIYTFIFKDTNYATFTHINSHLYIVVNLYLNFSVSIVCLRHIL